MKTRRLISKTTTMLLALVALLCAAALAPAARAETGEISAFGAAAYPPAPDQFWGPGPVALDPSDDNSIFVADLVPNPDETRDFHLRKFSKDGTQLASLVRVLSDPSGQAMYVVGIALDPELDRLYALAYADVGSRQTAREILVFSTVPDCPDPPSTDPCALVAPSGTEAEADGVDDGVLIDFRDGSGEETDSAVDFASGLAVDPGTNEVVVLGVDDATKSDPTGVLQYVSSAGVPATRVEGFGPGLDPQPEVDPEHPAVLNPAGLGIAPNGDVYIETASGYTAPFASASVYRMPRGGGTASLLVVNDNSPLALPGTLDIGVVLPVGSPITVSADGETVYIADRAGAAAALVRGFSTTTGAPKILYGTGDCAIGQDGGGVSLAAGAGGDLATVTWDFQTQPSDPPTVHLFGESDIGCPKVKPAFTVEGQSSGTIAVPKGHEVAFDATPSEVVNLGAPVKQLDWNFDSAGSGTYAPIPGSPASLTTSHRFLTAGTFQVGMKIESELGVPPLTDPVFRTVEVVPPKPIAEFEASTKTPAAGASVSFDASESEDPAGSPTAEPTRGDFETYKWEFGDGQTQETTVPTTNHAFANPDPGAVSRTVKLIVVSHDGVASDPAQLTLTVAGTPPSGGGGGGGGGGSTTPAPAPSPSPAPSPAPAPKPQPKKCKKGQVKKKGKCVKQKKRGKHKKA